MAIRVEFRCNLCNRVESNESQIFAVQGSGDGVKLLYSIDDVRAKPDLANRLLKEGTSLLCADCVHGLKYGIAKVVLAKREE